jgi:hypothetical protein
MESGTSPGSLEKGKELPEEENVHTQVTGTSVSIQSSLPALEQKEATTFSRRRNLASELSLLHFSRTPAYFPPSEHSSCEYSCPLTTPPKLFRIALKSGFIAS